MADEDKDQKTEPATPKKLEDARKKGDVAKSKEISSVAVLFAGLATLYYSSNFMLENLMNITVQNLMEAGTMEFTAVNMHHLLKDMTIKIGLITFPVALGVIAVAVASNIAQVGFMVSSESLVPKFSKINPLSGMKNLVSLRSLAELIKSVLKIVIISLVVYFAIKGEVDKVPTLMYLPAYDITLFIGRISFFILLKTGGILLVLAFLDFIYQKWEYGKKLRMTKQEIKDESKQSEGDPKVKSRIRALQREWARQRMMAEVPNADVVITNPTHFAVALKYKKDEMSAPVVTAKGRNYSALRIKEIAVEAGVPIVEDKPLARALYKNIEVGMEVPPDMYKAVAEVLAYVFKLGRRQVPASIPGAV